MALSPRTSTFRLHQAARKKGTAPQTSPVMQEALLLRLPIQKDDQETLEGQGRR